MSLITVNTPGGPVLVDEDGVEAWGGKVLPDAKPKPKGKARAVNVEAKAVNVEMVDDIFVLVDADGEQVGEQQFETIEAAIEALG